MSDEILKIKVESVHGEGERERARQAERGSRVEEKKRVSGEQRGEKKKFHHSTA